MMEASSIEQVSIRSKGVFPIQFTSTDIMTIEDASIVESKPLMCRS